MPVKKVKTGHLVSDAHAFDAPIRQESGNSTQSASSMINSDDESDQNEEMPPESCTVNSANLKLVYDVEYQPPE